LRRPAANVMGCLHDPANVQQTSSKCIQNTRANDERLLDSVNTLLRIDNRQSHIMLSAAAAHLPGRQPALIY